MAKIVTLLKRRPGLSPAEFQLHWREAHGPLLARLPGLRRYVQSHALLQGYAKGELLFDGIAELWFDDAAAWQRARRSPELAAAAAEETAFLDPAATVAMPVDVQIIKDGPIPPGAV